MFNLLRRKRDAYRAVFGAPAEQRTFWQRAFDWWRWLFGIKGPSYKAVFSHPSADVGVVLRDLARFCHADTSTFDPDPRIHAHREGRREVWLRIMKLVNLPDDRVRELSEKED